MNGVRVTKRCADGVIEIVGGEIIEVENPHPGDILLGYTAFRKDGWPLCPHCGEDELYSLQVPTATIDTIEGCYLCNWKPKQGAQ